MAEAKQSLSLRFELAPESAQRIRALAAQFPKQQNQAAMRAGRESLAWLRTQIVKVLNASTGVEKKRLREALGKVIVARSDPVVVGFRVQRRAIGARNYPHVQWPLPRRGPRGAWNEPQITASWEAGNTQTIGGIWTASAPNFPGKTLWTRRVMYRNVANQGKYGMLYGPTVVTLLASHEVRMAELRKQWGGKFEERFRHHIQFYLTQGKTNATAAR